MKLHALPLIPLSPPPPPPPRPATLAVALPFQSAAVGAIQPAPARGSQAPARGQASAPQAKQPAAKTATATQSSDVASPVAYRRGALVDIQA